MSLTENDFNYCVYMPDSEEDAVKRLKNMRRFNTKNTDNYLKIRYWLVKDETVARSVGIDTQNGVGELFLIRECTPSNGLKPNKEICSTKFRVKKFKTEMNKPAATYTRIMGEVFKNPIVVNDFMSFALLHQKVNFNSKHC